MKCPKCGAINKDDAAFCGKCGEKIIHKKKSKLNIKLLAIVAVAVVICGIVAFMLIPSKSYDDVLEEAQKYVEDKDYKQAETAYLEAIDIDPKKPDAYVELADVYMEQYKTDEAVDIMEKAKENVDTSDIYDKSDDIQKQVKVLDAMIYIYESLENDNYSMDEMKEALDTIDSHWNDLMLDNEHFIYMPEHETSGMGLGLYTDCTLLKESEHYDEYDDLDDYISVFLYYGYYEDGVRDGDFTVLSKQKQRLRFYKVTVDHDDIDGQVQCEVWELNEDVNQWQQIFEYYLNFKDHKLDGDVSAYMYVDGKIPSNMPRLYGTAKNGYYNRIPFNNPDYYVTYYGINGDNDSYYIYFNLKNDDQPSWFEFLP